MGTTAEKLTYLNTTKQNLKTVINTTGAGLTDESTFRSYANVLNDKILGAINGDVDLFEEYPKVSGNGTDLSLNGVVEGKMAITPQGVSNQKSTTGKNLFHILGLDVTTIPKVTSSSSVLNRVNNNEIVMTAVGTWSNVSIDFGENFFNTNQNIIASADFLETISGRTSKVGLQFYGSTNGETYTSIQTTGIIDINYNIKQHLSVIANTGEYTYIRLRIWNNVSSTSVSRGDSVINVSNIMMALGTDDTYEPYTGGIPAPSPSYPFSVKTVTGENSLVISNSDNSESQTYPISLGNIELNSSLDGTIRDGIIGKPNEWYKREYIGKVVLDGSENWTFVSNSAMKFSLAISGIAKPVNQNTLPKMLSDNFRQSTWNNAINSDDDYLMAVSTSNEILRIKDNDFSTLADFKAWLSLHNTIIYYPLAQYTDIPITDTTLISQLNDIYNNAHSYNGTTNITTTYEDGNEQMYLDIEALKNAWEVTE